MQCTTWYTKLRIVSACVAITLMACGCAITTNTRASTSGDWPNVGNDKGGTRYSPLDQINRDNVKDLHVAWTYHTGDAGEGTTIECTPIVIDGVMYVTTVKSKVVALNAATGEVIWRFDPYAEPPKGGAVRIFASYGVNRGLAFWSDGQPNGQRRVLVGLTVGELISLHADTGRPDPDFGESGIVDLRAGIEYDISKLSYGSTSAPAVFEDLVILGFSNSESMPSAPGDVRAFDVRTGKERWRFHTVPRPGEPFGETWTGDSWRQRGGANPWSGFTVSVQHGLVFCGTGSVPSDFCGIDRPGPNLFSGCTLALDARTGERRWHFQTLHHDLWDHDTPCPPVVVQTRHHGRKIDAVTQVTKTGYCFLFDLLTGKPLFDVQELPAPPSDIPGEQASPTQPIPVKPLPFARQTFTENDVTDIGPANRESVLEQLKNLRYGQRKLPPSLQGSVVSPGFHGGATWSGASFDPTTGYLYLNANDLPTIAKLNKIGDNYRIAGYNYFNDSEGYPAIKPPWGTLNAINLSTGEYVWRVPLGEFPKLKARGIPPTGTENFGGTIVTAGGLIFIGGTKDEKFHAFDKATGRLLWEYQLDAGGYATPCTYAVNGKQFVVIAAGGGGKQHTRSGDTFVAFSLPDPAQ